MFINRNLGVFDPEVTVFSHERGKLCCSTYQENQQTHGFYKNYYETYDEAIAILEKQGREDILLDASFKRKPAQEITSE